MTVKRVTNSRTICCSADKQWTAIIDKKKFRDWQVMFLHDSSDVPLHVKHCHAYGIALVHAKNFVNNPE